MAYTTVDAIGRRVRGRLQIGGGAPSAFGATLVDDDLLGQILEQVTARIDARLKKIYQFPLLRSHPELASVSEKLCICELMGVHFTGQEASDDANYGKMMCKQGDAELELIASGELPLEGENQLCLPITSIAPTVTTVISRRDQSCVPWTDPELYRRQSTPRWKRREYEREAFSSCGCGTPKTTRYRPAYSPSPSPSPTPTPVPTPQESIALVSTEFTASAGLSALRVVTNNIQNQLVYANAAVVEHAFKVIGILPSAVGEGQSIAPITEGTIEDASWNWEAGQPIFLGFNGNLTQSPPEDVTFYLQVAIALTPTKIDFEIQEPVLT